MSTAIDQGLAAIQRNDWAAAVAPLESACQADPKDYKAHMCLGVAFGHLDRHEDALRALTLAVQIEPLNAPARYNLGIALQRGGWPCEAATAFEQALMLQPDYPQARSALQQIRNTAPVTEMAVSSNPIAGNLPAAQPTVVMPAMSQSGGLPAYSMPPSHGPMPPPSRATGRSTPPAGQPPSGGYAAPYGQPAYAGYAPPAYYAAPAAGSAPGYGVYAQAPVADDMFDLVQAFRDWGQTIVAPVRFFTNQTGRTGIKAPMAILLAYKLTSLLVAIVSGVVHGTPERIPIAIVTQIATYLASMVGILLTALIVHLVGGMFGSTATYSGSVRALAYANGPSVVLLAAALFFVPISQPPAMTPFLPGGLTPQQAVLPRAATPYATQPGSPITMPAPSLGGSSEQSAPPFGSQIAPGQFGTARPDPFEKVIEMLMSPAFGAFLALAAVGAIWEFILMIIGLASIMRISGGAAFGTLFVSGIILSVIGFVVELALVAVAAASIVGAIAHGGLH